MTALKLTHTLQAGLQAEQIQLDTATFRSQLCKMLNCELLGCMKVLAGVDVWYDNQAAYSCADFMLEIDGKLVGNVAILLGCSESDLPIDAFKLAELLELTNKLQICDFEYA